MPVPNNEEIERRIREGITRRECELWLADELEYGATLLRRDDDLMTKEEMRNCLDLFKNRLDVILNCVKD